MKPKKMTPLAYEKRMIQHMNTFSKLWDKIVIDTNKVISDNPKIIVNTSHKIKLFTEDMIYSGAWIQDKLNGIDYTSKKSMTIKMDKTLGYYYHSNQKY